MNLRRPLIYGAGSLVLAIIGALGVALPLELRVVTAPAIIILIFVGGVGFGASLYFTFGGPNG